MELVNDGVDDLLGGFGEVPDVVEEALTQRHAVLQVLVGRHQVAPVILKLQVPRTLLLVLLLLLEFLCRLEVPLNVGLGLIYVFAGLPIPPESGTPVLLVLLGLPSQPVSVIIDIAFGIEVDLIDFEVLLEDLVQVGEIGVGPGLPLCGGGGFGGVFLVLEHGDVLDGLLALLEGFGWGGALFLDQVVQVALGVVVLVEDPAPAQVPLLLLLLCQDSLCHLILRVLDIAGVEDFGTDNEGIQAILLVLLIIAHEVPGFQLRRLRGRRLLRGRRIPRCRPTGL